MGETPLYERLLGRSSLSEEKIPDFEFSTLRRLDNESLYYITACQPDDHLHGRLCQFEIKRRSDTLATIALILSIISFLIALFSLVLRQMD